MILIQSRPSQSQKIRNQSFTYEYKRKLDESDEVLLNEAIPEIRERCNRTAKEIIVPFELDFKVKGAEFSFAVLLKRSRISGMASFSNSSSDSSSFLLYS